MIGDETIARGSGDTACIPDRKGTSGTWHGADDVKIALRIPQGGAADAAPCLTQHDF